MRVIFPAENDSGIMQTSDEMTGNELLESGARVYVYPGMTHVKAAIYDGWACLGSANFNKMSLRVGQELDVAFSDPATVARLKEELFETDFKRSRELTQPVPLNWFDSFVKAFGDELLAANARIEVQLLVERGSVLFWGAQAPPRAGFSARAESTPRCQRPGRR